MVEDIYEALDGIKDLIKIQECRLEIESQNGGTKWETSQKLIDMNVDVGIFLDNFNHKFGT